MSREAFERVHHLWPQTDGATWCVVGRANPPLYNIQAAGIAAPLPPMTHAQAVDTADQWNQWEIER